MSEAARTEYPPFVIEWRLIARAKRLMRAGLDLYETALALGIRPRDLDVSLWSHVGGEGWA